MVRTLPATWVLGSVLAGGLFADDFVRVRPGPGLDLEERPRRGQREVLHQRGVFVDMVASPTLQAELQGLGYELEVLQSDLSASLRTMRLPDAGHYHRQAEMAAEMRSWVAADPGVEVEVLGTGSEVLPGGERREILAARFGREPGTAKAKVLLFAGIHAREVGTTEVLLELGRALVRRPEGGAADPGGAEPKEVGEGKLGLPGARHWGPGLLADREIWLVPSLNPDGREHCFSRDPWWRKNRQVHRAPFVGVDLNRNFGFQWGRSDNGGSSGIPASGIYRGPEPFSEPESRALRDLAIRERFSASLALHSYGEMILVPYGFDGTPPPHRAMYDQLSARLAKVTGYQVGQVQEVLGYFSNGRHDDWLYAGTEGEKPMVAAVELEIGKTFFPDRAEVEALAERIGRAAGEVVAMAGADLRMQVEMGAGERDSRDLVVTVENHGIRDAEGIVLRVEHPEGAQPGPLLERKVGWLGGLGREDAQEVAASSVRFRLRDPPRAIRLVVWAKGVAPRAEERVLPRPVD